MSIQIDFGAYFMSKTFQLKIFCHKIWKENQFSCTHTLNIYLCCSLDMFVCFINGCIVYSVPSLLHLIGVCITSSLVLLLPVDKSKVGRKFCVSN